MTMEARWRLLVLACVLAGLLVPALASASRGPYAETRVRGLELGNPYSISAERALTLGTHQGYAPRYDELASGSLLAARGIRFGQQGVSATFRHGELAGRTIDEVVAGLRSGAISPNQLPILTTTRDGVEYTLNNRSLMALREAGMEHTVIQNVTGNAFLEQQLTQRLSEMGGAVPPDFVPIVRGR